MKVYISYNTTNNPHGGGNQFLKGLKKEFVRLGQHSENPHMADIVLFNSHHNIEEVAQIKSLYPKKKFVHRIDGPMRLYNSFEDPRDFIVYRACNSFADAIVFQSDWSKRKNEKLGLNINIPSVVICNAADPQIFFPKKQKESESTKIKLISTSFSSNVRKGFGVYDYLDKKLDFSKYEYSFAGNSPLEFQNIKMLGCLRTEELASQLCRHDIFITASENDPCSNSLIEAMSLDLPVVALNSGGHPEIVRKGGLLFNTKEEIIEKINFLSHNIDKFRNKIVLPSMEDTAQRYLYFFEKITNNEEQKK